MLNLLYFFCGYEIQFFTSNYFSEADLRTFLLLSQACCDGNDLLLWLFTIRLLNLCLWQELAEVELLLSFTRAHLLLIVEG